MGMTAQYHPNTILTLISFSEKSSGLIKLESTLFPFTSIKLIPEYFPLGFSTFKLILFPLKFLSAENDFHLEGIFGFIINPFQRCSESANIIHSNS